MTTKERQELINHMIIPTFDPISEEEQSSLLDLVKSRHNVALAHTINDKASLYYAFQEACKNMKICYKKETAKYHKGTTYYVIGHKVLSKHEFESVKDTYLKWNDHYPDISILYEDYRLNVYTELGDFKFFFSFAFRPVIRNRVHIGYISEKTTLTNVKKCLRNKLAHYFHCHGSECIYNFRDQIY